MPIPYYEKSERDNQYRVYVPLGGVVHCLSMQEARELLQNMLKTIILASQQMQVLYEQERGDSAMVERDSAGVLTCKVCGTGLGYE